MSLNTKRTALYFTNVEQALQVIIVKSGWNEPAMFHVIIENGETAEVTPFLWTSEQIEEKIKLKITRDSFKESTVVPSMIITDISQLKL